MQPLEQTEDDFFIEDGFFIFGLDPDPVIDGVERWRPRSEGANRRNRPIEFADLVNKILSANEKIDLLAFHRCPHLLSYGVRSRTLHVDLI